MREFKNRSARAARHPRERGIALIAVLLALLLVTIMGLALNAFGVLSLTISTNERQGTETLYVADAGASHARRLLMEMIQNAPPPLPGASVMDQFLTRGDGVACNADELSPSPPPPFVAGDAIPVAGFTYPAGSLNNYRVAVCDDDAQVAVEDGNMLTDTNGVILARAFGAGTNGASGVVEITISRVPLPGLLVDGNLRINGDPMITGPGGAAHANGNLELPGVPCADDYFSAVGSVTGGGLTGNCPAGTDPTPDERPGASSITIPPIQPSDLRAQADFLLGNDGVIRNQAGNPVVVPGWVWEPGNRQWKKSDNAITNGTYYADNQPLNGADGIPNTPDDAAGIEISGTPAGTVTLIATSYINISGNPNFIPDLTVGGTVYSMVAGTDLAISGNPATIYQGVHFAGHQIKFNGNPTINGQVIADNQSDYPVGGEFYSKIVQLLPGGFMEVSGNPTINVNAAGLLASLTQTGWRECRGTANPANPCL